LAEKKAKKKNISSEKEFLEYLKDPKPYNKIVECELVFENYDFQQKISCDNFLFKKDIYFNKSRFHEEVNFSKCLFEGEVIFGGFSKYDLKLISKNTVFTKIADFTNSHFTKTSSFSYCYFENVRFTESTFDQLTYFSYSIFKTGGVFFRMIFKDIVHFHGSKFFGGVDFSYTLFSKKTTFNHAEFESKTNFWSATFQDLADFTRAKFINKQGDAECRFENTVFNHSAMFMEVEFDILKFSNSVIRAQGYFLKTKIKNADRETYRVIKDQFLKQNNRIDALNYFKLEMVHKSKELKNLLVENKWNKKPIGDFLINFLNKVSNDYGLNWIQGVMFTLIVGLFFFALSLMFLNDFPYQIGFGNTLEGINYGMKYYFQFLIPTHKSNYLIQYNPSTGFYFLTFLAE